MLSISYLFGLDKNLAFGFAVSRIDTPCLAVPGLEDPGLARPGIAVSELGLLVCGPGPGPGLSGPGLAVYPIDSALQNFTTAYMMIKS